MNRSSTQHTTPWNLSFDVLKGRLALVCVGIFVCMGIYMHVCVHVCFFRSSVCSLICLFAFQLGGYYVRVCVCACVCSFFFFFLLFNLVGYFFKCFCVCACSFARSFVFFFSLVCLLIFFYLFILTMGDRWYDDCDNCSPLRNRNRSRRRARATLSAPTTRRRPLPRPPSR